MDTQTSVSNSKINLIEIAYRWRRPWCLMVRILRALELLSQYQWSVLR